MSMILTSFFDLLGKDYLDDDIYPENVELEDGKVKIAEDVNSELRKIFVDFTNYNFLDDQGFEENIGKVTLLLRLIVFPDSYKFKDPFGPTSNI
tara:strand:- start:19 stop:300 length:282 start_codon:yes stop_codon:yes gene_type:complete